MSKRLVVPTTTPEETLGKVREFLKKFKLVAIGVASFGPIDMNPESKTYGFITSVPKQKQAWRNCNILSFFSDFDVPFNFTTDVQAAALGELQYGQHGPIHSCCYITVGTGVGVGVVINHRPVFGLLHPEGGHIRVAKKTGDDYEGFCNYHKDCIEGLVSAPAIADRLQVTQAALADLSDDHPVWDTIAHYLALTCAHLCLLVSPQVIVLGGGVMKRACLFPKIRSRLLAELNGYLIHSALTQDGIDKFVVPSVADHPNSGTNAGSVGALEIARLVANL